jgi:hypothetical protein
MPTLQVVGTEYATARSSFDTTGSIMTSAYPVKTFLIKPMGGDVLFKRASTIADAQSYQISDGEAINFDIKMPYSTSNGGVEIGFIKGVSGTVEVHFIFGY